MKTKSPVQQFIIRNSGGLIKNESQAMLVIISVFVLSVVFSFLMLYKTFAPPTTTTNIDDFKSEDAFTND